MCFSDIGLQIRDYEEGKDCYGLIEERHHTATFVSLQTLDAIS